MGSPTWLQGEKSSPNARGQHSPGFCPSGPQPCPKPRGPQPCPKPRGPQPCPKPRGPQPCTPALLWAPHRLEGLSQSQDGLLPTSPCFVSGTEAPTACGPCIDIESGSPHRYEASEESSDSDVELVRPRQVKRRRLLPGTVPASVSVYSNKVNSSLKLPPDNSKALLQMSELHSIRGSEDVESEIVPPVTQQKPPTKELTDSETDETEPPNTERLRTGSPSPPPTPKTPVRRKGRAYNKIREMDARLRDLGTVLSPGQKVTTEENDVIVVGSSPAPELTVKVRRGGKLFRINLAMWDPLEKLAQSMASQLNVEPSRILLLLGDEELNKSQTPKSMNLTVADIIDCVVLSPPDGQEDSDPNEKICIKVQGKEKQSHLSVMVGKVEPLQSLMDQYQAAMGLTKKHKVSFFFEGQKLKGKNTAEELGLESDDIIEVWA
ncbi:NFATC2-interacting protein [Xenopus tropicalis]|uniref:NFATC2-interacting protein n=1 Tax=Xenopus tropicalis TaxID=8364 RepID=NF2IP_XENTR